MFRPLWLGCRSLLLALKRQPAGGAVERERVKRILLIRRDRLGDVILTSALLSPLARLFQHAEILFWINGPLLPLFEQESGFTVVGERPEGAFDLVIDPLLDYPLAPAKVAASFDATWTLGFDVAGRGRWFTHPVTPPEADEHFLKSLARLLAPLGGGDVAPPQLQVTALERGNARELTGFGGNYVLVHPGAFYPAQRWPAGHVAQLIDMLEAEEREVAVIGGAGDEAVLDDVRGHLQRFDHACFLCGLPLRQVMALMAEASLLVCNNSGPLHLATALGVPTLSTLGPTNPQIWWPAGDHARVLTAPQCRHCEEGNCHRGCLARIRPEEVLKAAEAMLAGRRD